MTHPTLTRAAIAITAIVLGARADAQDGAADDPVRAERARIEAAVAGAQEEQLDRQLVQFVANALITGNENGVRDLGVAGIAPLKRLALEYDVGDLATYHWNPVVAIAWTAPDEAVATLGQALSRSPRRFSALSAIERGLEQVASIVKGQPGQVSALRGIADRALSTDGLSPAERETVALACLKHGIRSDAIDSVALGSPRLVSFAGQEGAALRFETTGELDPRYSAEVVRAVWARDRASAIALAGSEDEDVRAMVAGVLRPSTMDADDPATAALLELLDDGDPGVARAAARRFYELAQQRPNALPREVLEARVGLLVEQASAEAAERGRVTSVQREHYELIWALDRAADDGHLVGLAVQHVSDTADGFLQSNVQQALQNARVSTAGVIAAFAASQGDPRDGFRRPMYTRIDRVSDAEGDAILRRALLSVRPEHGLIWDTALRKGALDGLEGELAAAAVEVYASQPEADTITELLEVAATWSDCGPAMRSVAADAAKAPFERYLAVGCLLRSGSFVPTDTALVTEVLLAVDASDEVRWDRTYRIASNRYSLRDERARLMLADAIIRAWNTRLDEGRPFRVVRMSSNLENAPQPLVDSFMTLAARAYESPARAFFFEANGLAVVATSPGPDGTSNEAWKLVVESIAKESGLPHAFELALERGWETAALEGALRALEDPSSGPNGHVAKDFVTRIVGLKAFRADAKHASRLAEALASSGKVELMKAAKEALDEIAALKEVAARIADPTDAVAAEAAPDLRETLFEWIAAGQVDGADETAYKVGAIALQTLADLGDPRDRDYFRGLIESPIYGMDSERAAAVFRTYLKAWSRR